MCAVKRAGRRRHDIGRNREEAKVSSRVWVHHEAGGPAWLKDCRPRPGARQRQRAARMVICWCKEGTGRRVTKRRALEPRQRTDRRPICHLTCGHHGHACKSPQIGGAFLLQTLAIADAGGGRPLAGRSYSHAAAAAGGDIAYLYKVSRIRLVESRRLLLLRGLILRVRLASSDTHLSVGTTKLLLTIWPKSKPASTASIDQRPLRPEYRRRSFAAVFLSDQIRARHERPSRRSAASAAAPSSSRVLPSRLCFPLW